MIRGLTLLVALGLWCGATAPNSLSDPGRLRADSPHRAQVIIVDDPRAVFAFDPDPEVAEQMVNRGMIAWTGKTNVAQAWQSLVSTQDVVGLKVFSSPGPACGTRPAVVRAVIKGLLAAGQPPDHIVVWDKRLIDLRLAGFVALAQRLGVQAAGSADEGYDDKVPPYDTPLLGKLVWGDFEFGKKGDDLGRKSYVSKLVSRRLTKIINISPLANHNLAQVSGNLYSLALGSVDNTIRFESSPGALSQAVPEIYALPQVGDKVVLNIVDALICQYQGEEHTLLHYSTMLCQIRLSTDPVALDVLSVEELDRQRQLARVAPVKPNLQIYTNASLLELGIADPHLIDVLKIGPPDANRNTPSRPHAAAD